MRNKYDMVLCQAKKIAMQSCERKLLRNRYEKEQQQQQQKKAASKAFALIWALNFRIVDKNSRIHQDT